MARCNAKPAGRRSGQRKYSDVAIDTALTLRALLHLPLRQTEDSLLSTFESMGLSFLTCASVTNNGLSP